MKKRLYCAFSMNSGCVGYLIYNDSLAYADLVLNGDPKAYFKVVAEYKSLD